MTNPLTTAEAAAIKGVSVRRIQLLLQKGRIPGAEMKSGVWLLPHDFVISPPAKRFRNKS